MAANIIYEPGYNISVVASYPASPVSGGVCIYGDLAGIAKIDENATTGETTVNFGPWIADLSVTDSNTGGIAKGAPLFASKATPVVISNDSTGVFLGYANEAVDDGATATIEVIHPPMIGGIMSAGAIGTTELAPGAVTATEIGSAAVTADKIGSDAVKTVNILDANVTNAKLATDNVKIVTAALTAGVQDAFCLAWENPEAVPILVTRILVDITTAGGTAAAVLDFGAAADATTTSATLLDGVDANAVAIYDNLLAANQGGTVVKLDENGGTTAFITGQILTAAASDLVGNAYIFYTEV
ncbi:MAG: hypothetical protein PHZ06_12700 [Proteiniphilum sp.]|nr:hypothetical protein [Proteiniphilum sp.]